MTDTQPPATPAQPTVHVLLPGVIDVSWPAATDNVGVTGYALYDGTSRVALTARHQRADQRADHRLDAQLHGGGAGRGRQRVGARARPTTVTLTADDNLAQGKPVTVSSLLGAEHAGARRRRRPVAPGGRRASACRTRPGSRSTSAPSPASTARSSPSSCHPATSTGWSHSVDGVDLVDASTTTPPPGPRRAPTTPSRRSRSTPATSG